MITQQQRVFSAMGLVQLIAMFTVATPSEPHVSVISNVKMPANDYFILALIGLFAKVLNCLPLIFRYYEHRKVKLARRKLMLNIEAGEKIVLSSDSQAVEESC